MVHFKPITEITVADFLTDFLTDLLTDFGIFLSFKSVGKSFGGTYALVYLYYSCPDSYLVFQMYINIILYYSKAALPLPQGMHFYIIVFTTFTFYDHYIKAICHNRIQE